jgi:drug/metabolite transporter (DMT)-like permease
VTVLALLWGSTFLWIEVALGGMSPVQVTFSRCALGSATLLVSCLAAGAPLPRGLRTWRHLLVAAFFCNALPFALFSVGQQTISSGVAGVLNTTTPLWSLLLGLVLGGERGIRPSRWCGLLLGFGGTVVIFAPWQEAGGVRWGALAIVAAAASYAVGFSYMGRHLVGQGIPTISLSAAQLCAATGLTGLWLPAGGLAPVHLDPATSVAVLVLGVLTTGVTFHLTYRIIADEGATNAATVGYLLPVVSVVLGSAVLGEEISGRVITGMVIVLVGVALSRRRTPDVPEAPSARATPASHVRVGGISGRPRR